MLPEDNIDDLFRGQLDGHATPPGDDLWARLQNSAPQPEAHDPRLEELFLKSLGPHATPPRRELWERLEDEHLRPRQRRAAAWWPLAMAAAVLILLLAGGAGLWLGFPFGKMVGRELAIQKGKDLNTATIRPAAAAPASTVTPAPTATTHSATAAVSKKAPAADDGLVANNAAATPKNTVSAAIQKNTTAQATRSLALASTASKARKLAERQSPRHPLGSTRQPDAAAPSPSLVARTTVPLAAPAPARNPAADEPHLNAAPAPVLAQASTPTPTAEIVPAGALITVDVRSGTVPAARSIRRALSDVASANAEPAERRGLGGRLLQQAGHLVRGERMSLAEVANLPENITLNATIAGRRVSKSIQL